MCSDRLEFLMNQAEEFVQAGDYEGAIAIFQQALQIAPKNTDVLRQYGKALARNSQDQEAFKIFEKALDISPSNVDVLRNYGTELAKKKLYNKAFENFKKALEVNHEDVKVLVCYGKALRQADKFDESFKIFRKLLEIDNYNASIIDINFYGRKLAVAGRYQEAIEIFKRSLKIDHKNQNTRNSYVLTLNTYANALKNAKNYSKACKLYQESLRFEADKIETLFSYAKVLNIMKNKECFKIFEKLLELKHDDILTLTHYGKALADFGEHEKAIDYFNKALEIKDDDKYALALLGTSLTKLKDYKLAHHGFKKCLDIDRDNPIALSGFVKLLIETREYRKAAKYSEYLLKLEGEDDNVITLNRYAKALIGLQLYDKAIEVYKKIIYEIKPNSPYMSSYMLGSILGQYGMILAILKNYKEACLRFRESLQNKPSNYILFEYARALESLEKYQDAIQKLETIQLEQLTQYQVNIIRVNLGRLYYLIKQPKKGYKYFEEVIANSDDKEKTLLYSARSILVSNSHNDTAIEMLQQIAKDSPRYAQALEMLTLNLSEEDYFEMVKTDSQSGLSDTEILNRAMYHKIANEISILKGIAYRILRRSEREDPLLSSIIQDIEDVFEEVNKRRAAQKSEIETIPYDDYRQILAVISKTAHDISDFVNNQLAVIESKTRRAMRKLTPEDEHYVPFEKLLAQLELTQTALSDLKAINEGITIKNHRFKVKELFEKWETTPQIDNARIILDIRNRDSQFYGDEEKIKSALNELVENSLKHNSDRRNLTIYITSEDMINPPGIRGMTIPGEQKYLVIEFADNGKGVPEDHKNWIFQLLKTTSEEGKGSGLGLFIIRKTLTKMNGYIRETGEDGARFEIYIPYFDAENR